MRDFALVRKLPEELSPYPDTLRALVLLFGCCSVAKLYLTLSISLTVACQGPLTVGFSRQKYWSGLPCPSAGDLLDPGIEPVSPVLTGRFFTTEPPGRPGCTSRQKCLLPPPHPTPCSLLPHPLPSSAWAQPTHLTYPFPPGVSAPLGFVSA